MRSISDRQHVIDDGGRCMAGDPYEHALAEYG
jgi:hypothetical protein